MKKILWRIIFAILIIIATLGMLAYVMQTALGEPITFREFFERFFGDMAWGLLR